MHKEIDFRLIFVFMLILKRSHSSIESIATLVFKLGSLLKYETLFEILHVAASILYLDYLCPIHDSYAEARIHSEFLLQIHVSTCGD